MTIGTKMHQTLNTLRSLQAEMSNYALDTEDPGAKTMFTDCANQLEDIACTFSSRVEYIEQEESQYNVYTQQ